MLRFKLPAKVDLDEQSLQTRLRQVVSDIERRRNDLVRDHNRTATGEAASPAGVGRLQAGYSSAPPPLTLPETVHVPTLGQRGALRTSDLLPGDRLLVGQGSIGWSYREVVSAQPRHQGSKWWNVVTRYASGQERTDRMAANALHALWSAVPREHLTTAAERLADEADRLEARAERLEERSGKHGAKAAAAFEASHRAVEGIPMGQPILVGHHSERRHRRAVERSHAALRRGGEHYDTSKRLGQAAERRAKEAERVRASASEGDSLRERAETIEQLFYWLRHQLRGNVGPLPSSWSLRLQPKTADISKRVANVQGPRGMVDVTIRVGAGNQIAITAGTLYSRDYPLARMVASSIGGARRELLGYFLKARGDLTPEIIRERLDRNAPERA